MRPTLLTTLASALLLTGLFPGPAPAQEKNALEIFDHAVSTFEAQRAALRKWQYHQTLTTHQLDGSGKIVARGTWKYIVRPGDSGPYEYTSEQLEGKLSFFKSGSEEGTPVPEKKAKPEVEEKNQAEAAIEAVRKYNLRDRYNWKTLPEESVAGESAYVLVFEPKPGQIAHSREERFFSLLSGRMWVSRDDFTILKAQATLQAPCNLFWVIARVTKFEFTYKLEPAHGGERLLRLSKASAKTVVAFPFYSVRQRHWLTIDRFEPRIARGISVKP